jgi:WxcM-like, C-terminal
MRGVELLDLGRHTDDRGALLAFAGNPQLPFEVQNVYFILDCPPAAVRAEHSTSNDSAIIALSSSVTVDLDNGSERQSHRLTAPDTALIVRAGVWLRLRDFSDQTRIVVLSSAPYDEMDHSDGPAPELLDELEP